MNVTKEQLHKFSHAELLEYTLKLREEIEQNGYVYPYATSYFDLPEELRTMIIDKMDAVTRVRFRRCSTLCAEETKKSKNYLYGIKVENNENCDTYYICFHLTNDNPKCPHFRYTFRENRSRLNSTTTTVCHEKLNYWGYTESGIMMVYNDDDGAKWSKDNQIEKVKWKVTEDGKAKDVLIKYLEKFLEEYKNVIKCFANNSYRIDLTWLNLKHLKKIDNVKLNRGNDMIENECMTLDQVLKCKERILLPETELSFEELIQLKANSIYIGGKDLTNEHIKRYLKMWEDGEIDENIRTVKIRLNGLHMDAHGLQLLDEEFYTDGLLTVLDRNKPAKQRTYCTYFFTFLGAGKRETKVWLSKSGIQLTS